MSFLSRSTRSLLLPPPLFPSVFCVIVHNMRGEQRARACHPGGGRDLGSPFSGCSRVAYLNPGTSPEGNTTRYHFFIIYPSLSPIFCQKKLGFSLFQEFWEGEVGHTSLVVQHRVRRKKKKHLFHPDSITAAAAAANWHACIGMVRMYQSIYFFLCKGPGADSMTAQRPRYFIYGLIDIYVSRPFLGKRLRKSS